MSASLRVGLRIFDHAPVQPANTQVWQGGATDLATRTMLTRPPHWLLIADQDPEDAPPVYERPPLRAWQLEPINPGTLAFPDNAGGVILVSMNVEPAFEAEFNDWYNTEHIPHLSRLDGVITARRFRAITGNPRYVALYHVVNTDIYATPGWMAANHTPWMLRMRRYQRDRTYFMFRERIA